MRMTPEEVRARFDREVDGYDCESEMYDHVMRRQKPGDDTKYADFAKRDDVLAFVLRLVDDIQGKQAPDVNHFNPAEIP